MTYLLDASGVIYNDGRPFPGVVETIQSLQRKAAVYLATNNTSASPQEIAESLGRMGIQIPVSHILSSGLTLAADPELQQWVSGKPVFLYGLPGAEIYVTAAGGYLVSDPEAALAVVFTHATAAALSDPLFCRMAAHQHQHPDRPMICLNPDRYVVSGATLYPVVGHIAERFPEMRWAGKPHDNYAWHVIRPALLQASIMVDDHVTFVDDNPDNVAAMCRCLGISGVVVTETGLSQYAPWRSRLQNLDSRIRCVSDLSVLGGTTI